MESEGQFQRQAADVTQVMCKDKKTWRQNFREERGRIQVIALNDFSKLRGTTIQTCHRASQPYKDLLDNVLDNKAQQIG